MLILKLDSAYKKCILERLSQNIILMPETTGVGHIISMPETTGVGHIISMPETTGVGHINCNVGIVLNRYN